MQNWAVAELETVKFGDRRLKHRLMRIVERMAERPASSIPAACKSWAETKATYRFLSSDKVAAEVIRAAHRENTTAVRSNTRMAAITASWIRLLKTIPR